MTAKLRETSLELLTTVTPSPASQGRVKIYPDVETGNIRTINEHGEVKDLGGGLSEAPTDERIYGRHMGEWTSIGGAGTGKVIYAESDTLELQPEDSGATIINLTDTPVNVTLPNGGTPPYKFDFYVPTDGDTAGDFYPHFKIIGESPSGFRRNILRGGGSLVKHENTGTTSFDIGVDNNWKDALTYWVSRSSSNDLTPWRDVCWSPELGLFVSVAVYTPGETYKLVQTSSDGVIWTERDSANETANWCSVCWSTELSLFVAVANGAASGFRVMTSPDGVNWTGRTSGNESVSWRSVCWSGTAGLFVAVGDTGSGNRIMTSTDGINWTSRSSSNDGLAWYSVSWSDALLKFVIVANTATTGNVNTSSDGVTWTPTDSANSNLGWKSVCWAPDLNSFFAISGLGGFHRLMKSSNGVDWLTVKCPNNAATWEKIIWDPSTKSLIAIASGGAGQRIMTSYNGFTWFLRDTPYDTISFAWYGICSAPELNTIVSVSTSGTGNRVMTCLV